MRIGICGACGRMGISILELALERGHELAAAFDMPEAACMGQDAGVLIHGKELGVKITTIDTEILRGCDCVIDFSSPSATMQLLPLVSEHKIKLVIGTTGFSDDQKAAIEKAAQKTAIVFSPNMAVGVNLLFKLTEVASAALNSDFDVEIFEAHHRFKKDAPSGTAKELASIVKKNMPGMEDAREVTGREGLIGERTSKEIGVMAMRGGNIVGEHTVYFVGQGERLELTIRSSSRETYARGAVMAAEFLVDKNKETNLFTMFHVLGLQ